MRILHLHHCRARAAWRYDWLIALKHADRMLRLLTGQFGIAAVEHRLPTTGLVLWKIDFMPQPPKDADRRLSCLRANHIAQAGNHEGELHAKRGPPSFLSNQTASVAGR